MDDQQSKVLDKTMMYLAQRDHSVKELKTKLAQKKFEKPLIDWAIDYCQKSGWLKDPLELSDSTKRLLDRKYKGALYIQKYLQEKGLPPVDIDFESELEKARHWAEVLSSGDQELSFEDRQRLARKLQSRGFTNDIIKKVIYENE